METEFYLLLIGLLSAGYQFYFVTSQTSSIYTPWCNNFGDEIVCYFLSNQSASDWSTASRACLSANATLPKIKTQMEQSLLITYLNFKRQRHHSVWTSGKKKVFDKFTWIKTGQEYNEEENIEKVLDTPTHVMLRQNCTLRAENPFNRGWFTCQYVALTPKCIQSNHMKLTSSCLEFSTDGNANWYEARNYCLSKNQDLAVLTNDDLNTIKDIARSDSQFKSIQQRNYWIGLRKMSWYWIPHVNDSKSSEEITFSNGVIGSRNSSDNRCIIVRLSNDQYNGQWYESDCVSTKHAIVCETRARHHSWTEETSLSQAPSITATLSIDGKTALKLEYDCISNTAFVLSLIMCLVLCVIFNVIVGFLLKRKYSKAGKNLLEDKQYQELQTRSVHRVTNSDPYTTLQQVQPEYEEVTPHGL